MRYQLVNTFCLIQLLHGDDFILCFVVVSRNVKQISSPGNLPIIVSFSAAS